MSKIKTGKGMPKASASKSTKNVDGVFNKSDLFKSSSTPKSNFKYSFNVKYQEDEDSYTKISHVQS